MTGQGTKADRKWFTVLRGPRIEWLGIATSLVQSV